MSRPLVWFGFSAMSIIAQVHASVEAKGDI